MKKYAYITGLALLLAACSGGSDSDVSEVAPETPPATETVETVETEPTGMNAGEGEPVDMDYTRISFDKGAVSAQVNGVLKGFEDENEFVIDVAEGQVMTVKKVGNPEERISIWIKSPVGDDLVDRDLGCNGEASVTIPMSGDYSILVSQCMKADPWNNAYTLDVTVK